ncbi:MAG: aminoglycoside phosphotransferase family protein [Cyanobacteria bacterium HKST-UBA04]|nr:aminoglycoside phosphotransferase family protein [Cyanobacteria bacterium HKST-UBA04]
MALDRELTETLIRAAFPRLQSVVWGTQAEPQDISFYVIPGKGACPRWLVPVDARKGEAALALWNPMNARSRLIWQLLKLVYHFGWLGHVPGVEMVSLKTGYQEPSDLGYHVVYVGTPSHVQRLITIKLDPETGKALTVSKIPYGPHARAGLEQEAYMLNWLAQHFPGHAPVLLNWDGESACLTQSVKPGHQIDTELTRPLIEWLRGLARPNQFVTLADALIELRGWLSQQPLDDSDRLVLAYWIQHYLDQDALVDRPLPAVVVHGDFCPWNIKTDSNGHVHVVDWENAREQGLPGFDLIHFFHIVRIVEGRTTEGLCQRLWHHEQVRAYCQCFDIDEAMWQAIYGLYVFDQLRYTMAFNLQPRQDLYMEECRRLADAFTQPHAVH